MGDLVGFKRDFAAPADEELVVLECVEHRVVPFLADPIVISEWAEFEEVVPGRFGGQVDDGVLVEQIF